MKSSETASQFSNGSIAMTAETTCCADLKWNEHPVFKGVFLKNILRAEQTDGGLSAHIVRLEPGSVLMEHIHEEQWELHEVISGEGTAKLAGKILNYTPGSMAVIPKGTTHMVEAGNEGLVLLAKFFPGN